jgi:shikimate 5-dehydrogenase
VSTIWFVGVSTAGSMVHRAMPRWRPVLGLGPDVSVVGHDVPVGASPGVFRALLGSLARDPAAIGAVVTTHKVALFAAGSGMFGGLDDLAVACGEVNAVRRTGGGLLGFARDPVSVGRVVDRIWPSGAGAGGDCVCLGAGGTAVALGRHLLGRAAPPRLVFADPRRSAVSHLGGVLGGLGGSVTTVVGDGPWDSLVGSASPGSLVVNATGMGKDRPGSPLTRAARFPLGSVVWELNYRGDLPLLAQASAQGVSVHDGWSLFCQGWAAALAAVLDIDLDDDVGLGDRLCEAAHDLRPGGALPPCPT